MVEYCRSRNSKSQIPNIKWFDKPFDRLTVLSKVEGLTTLSQVEGQIQISNDPILKWFQEFSFGLQQRERLSMYITMVFYRQERTQKMSIVILKPRHTVSCGLSSHF